MPLDDQQLFASLSEIEDVALLRSALRRVLTEAVDAYHSDSSQSRVIAYSVAGLLNLDLVRPLPENDPIVEVLSMAGQLELPKRLQADGATWRRLEELVRVLPT